MRIHRGIRLEYFSNSWMAMEVAGSVLAGVLAGSLALVAFGADSLVEFLSGFVVLKHLRSDSKGSEMRGTGTARLTSVLLLSLIPTIGLSSLFSYSYGIKAEGSLLGIAIASGAVIVMPFLFLEKRRIGRQTRSLPLSTDALASATCLLMSLVLLGGLLVVYLTGFWWIDYAATAIILAFVGKEGMESLREASE